MPRKEKSPGPENRCEPFRQVMEAKLRRGLTCQRSYQDMVSKHGFGAGYCGERWFAKRLDQSRSIPFRRMGVPAGKEVQMDFGTGAPILRPEGKMRGAHFCR
jgi:hypothetical protein